MLEEKSSCQQMLFCVETETLSPRDSHLQAVGKESSEGRTQQDCRDHLPRLLSARDGPHPPARPPSLLNTLWKAVPDSHAQATALSWESHWQFTLCFVPLASSGSVTFKTGSLRPTMKSTHLSLCLRTPPPPSCLLTQSTTHLYTTEQSFVHRYVPLLCGMH